MTLSRFAAYAWLVLVYNVGVIVWGAYVRASGSGAGCGSHWPSCQGEAIPRPEQVETLIEFIHRATSGLALLLVVGLLVWAVRAFPRRHAVRRGATLSLAFVVAEALIGAGLVLFGLTAKNDSVVRAASLAVHLANTFLLLAALALTAWWASGGAPLRPRGRGGLAGAFALAMLGTLLVSATGAVTALGDTLFPAGSLAEGLRQDVSPTAHLLVQLRVIHPVLAIAVGVYIILLGARVRFGGASAAARRLAGLLSAVVAAQLAAGVVNLALLAPIPLQLIHLLLADLVWLALVLTAAAALAAPAPAPEAERPEARAVQAGV